MKKLIDHAVYHHAPIMAAPLAQPAETIAAADPALQMAEVANLESAPFSPEAPTDVDAGAITINAVPTITGTPGDDILVGDGNNNLIFGFGGNDVLIGEAGADVLNGG